MPSTATSQDKLFGLLAVQLGFITADALKKHSAEFARQGATAGFGTWLVKAGVLTLADVALLEACVAQGVKTHHTVARALNALTLGAQAFTESFAGFDDTYSSGERGVVSSESLEGLEFVVPEMPGRYTTTDSELGRGGLGRVLAFKDHVLGRTIAWKELHRQGGRELDTLASMEQEARFLREARLAAQLEHPGIVPIYEAGRRLDGALYYTMRRIEGRTLHDALEAAGTLEARLKLMPHLIAVTQALAYAHSRDVLHRDVKPQNVMFGKFGETYLLDWGLAKVKIQSTSGSDSAVAPDISAGIQVGAVGTPSYMSPEQAAGRHDIIDHRTDVWGVGAILYQVLTGRPPYVGASPIDCVARILRDEVLPPKVLEPGAPNDLVAVCMKALQRSPANRYATAAEMAGDLQAWLEGRTVSAREYSQLSRAWRFARRHKFAVSVVSALFLALVVTGTLFTARLNSQKREARALSGTVLHAFIEQLVHLPGAESILDEIATPTLDYYRAQGDLSDDELVLFGQTLQAMGFNSLTVGRLDTSRKLFDECVQRLPLGVPRSDVDEEYRAAALTCVVGQGDVAGLTGDSATQTKRLVEAKAAVEKWSSSVDVSPRWLRAMSISYSRLGLAAQNAGHDDEAMQWIDLEWKVDAKAVERAPKDLALLNNHAASSTRLALMLFKPNAPEQALEISRHGLESLKRVPRASQSPRVLRVWLGLLEQLVMMLGWAGRDDEAKTYADEAKGVFELLMNLEPNEGQGRAVYADLLLARQQPCEAKRLYDALIAEGMRGTYFTSWLLASLACGETAPFEALTKKEVDASEDPQVKWLYALWLVQVGRAGEAATLLDAVTEAASDAAIQWPRGVLDEVPARVPVDQRGAVQTFITETESNFRAEGPTDVNPYEHLAESLR